MINSYEYISTGGSEWVQEDMIELNDIKIPDPKHEIDLCMLQNVENPKIPEASDSMLLPAADTAVAFITRTKSVPSLSTVHSVRKSIMETGNRYVWENNYLIYLFCLGKLKIIQIVATWRERVAVKIIEIFSSDLFLLAYLCRGRSCIVDTTR